MSLLGGGGTVGVTGWVVGVDARQGKVLVRRDGAPFYSLFRVGRNPRHLTCTCARDGTPFYSLFRVGLDFLRRLLLNLNPDLRVWDDAIHVLSST